MNSEEMMYEIARYSEDGEQLLERYQLLSDGTSHRRRDPDGTIVDLRHRWSIDTEISCDPELHEVRCGQWTRIIAASTCVDELPLLLRAPGSLPDTVHDPYGDQYEDPDTGHEENNLPRRTYRDRKVEVNGQEWFTFTWNVLPADNAWSYPRLSETWGKIAFNAEWSSLPIVLSGSIVGLITPRAVMSVSPDWATGEQIVQIDHRHHAALHLREWIDNFGPDDWGARDSKRIRTQLLLEASASIGECHRASGAHLAAGLTKDPDSFGTHGDWELTLTTTPEVVDEVIELLARDHDVADLIAASFDPQFPLSHERRAALTALSARESPHRPCSRD